MRTRTVSPLLVLIVVFAAVGCAGRTVPIGTEGMRVRTGPWVGSSDDGAFQMQFIVGADGTHIVLLDRGLPCGEQTLYMFGANSVRIELDGNAFEKTIDSTDDPGSLRPKLVLTGRFIDSTHAEGSWQMSALGDTFLGIACPAANGTWQGSPD